MIRILVLFFLFFTSIASAQNLVAVASDNGLSSLTFGGYQFLGNGDFRVNGILMQRGDSPPFYADTSASVEMNRKQMFLIRRYSWGTVRVSYAAGNNKLLMNISTTNTSDATIVGVYYEPLGLRFPSAVKEYNGTDPLLADNIGAPSVVGMSYAAGTLALVNEDVYRPLEIGFPWAWDKPGNTFFPLRISTNRDAMYPAFTPAIDRPIPPGITDVYQISLRFGPAGADPADLGLDVTSRFPVAFPPTLNWKDRRPVGALFLATSGTGWATNPRGWFLDPAIDVTTPVGIAAFQARVMQYADTSIRYLKSMNAQGMITWDIEGEQYPQATSYACDPRQLATLAGNEFRGGSVLSEISRLGLRVGVCVRPQDLVVQAGTEPGQVEVADPARLLIAKIRYARDRWGATLFYVDSNGGPNDPMDPAIFRKVAAEFPDVLLIPEHSSPKYWAYSSPGVGLRDGLAATPSPVKSLYPGAFSLLFTLDGPIASRYQELVEAVRSGDVLMFRAWFDDQPANSLLKQIQQDAIILKP